MLARPLLYGCLSISLKVILCCALFPCILWAQSPCDPNMHICMRVMDQQGRPLSGAQVSIRNQFFISTDSLGLCHVSLEYEGDTAHVVMDGYSSQTLFFAERRNNFISIYLSPQQVQEKWRVSLLETSLVSMTQQVDFSSPSAFLSTSIEDVLQKQGLSYTLRSHAADGVASLSGMSPEYTAILIDDNVYSSSASYSLFPSLALMDPQSVSKVTVHYGDRTASVGSSAIAGSVDIQTYQPQVRQSSMPKLDLTYSAQMHTARNQQKGQVSLEYREASIASWTSIQYARSGDQRAGQSAPTMDPSLLRRDSIVITRDSQDLYVPNPDPHILTPSGFDHWRLQQKLLFRPTSHWSMTAAVDINVLNDIPLYGELTLKNGLNPEWAQNQLSSSSRQVLSLTSTHIRQTPLWDKLQWSVSNQRKQRSQDYRRLHSVWLHEESLLLRTTDFQVDMVKDMSDLFPGLQIKYGAHIHYHRMSSSSTSESLMDSSFVVSEPTSGPSSSRLRRTELYARGNYTLEPWDIDLHGGLRVGIQNATLAYPWSGDLIDLESISALDRWSKGHWALFLAGSHEPSPQLGVYTRLDLGYRNPYFQDWSNRSSNHGIVVLPNPHLRNERSFRWELGADYRLSVWWPFSNTQVKASAYLQTVSQKIGLVPTRLSNGLSQLDSEALTYLMRTSANLGKLSTQGLILSLNTDIWGHHHLAVMLTASHTSADLERQTTLNVPSVWNTPLYGNIRWLTKLQDWSLEGVVGFNGASAAVDGPLFDVMTLAYPRISAVDSWIDGSIYVHYQWGRFLEFAVGLENIRNQAHMGLGSGIPNPGRQLSIRIAGSISQN